MSKQSMAADQAEAGNLTYFAFIDPERAVPLAGSEPPPAPATATFSPQALPEVLGGRYRLERLLGVGGMGAVYRARDLLREQFGDPDPYVALKVLSEEFAEYPDASALLYSEYALTMRLRHPHVVRLHSFEVDTACQRAFITLELMRGLTLDQLLSERPQGLPWDEFREVAGALLDALAYSHERGVLHGDLKPSNVMLGEDGLRLFDYGLGQARDGLLDGLPKLCRARIAAWTPRYAALELLEGAPLSPASDLYAVACVLYELLCGTHPYRRLNAKQARAMQLEQQLAPPAQLPRPAWQALRCALALNEADRQISVAQLRDAFRTLPPQGLRRWFRWRNG
ncbi:serine/threonine protein kinase [Pseudomonas sp. R3.Fl]|uniref:serine/threonine-protein kinase n=1 Tax=Pseudomonas TaxID=286 RepID=UPI000EDCBFE4|nr:MULTISPECIES: serine/threonine-protein kinase [Pseudomonas]MCL6691274.1 serine/threonine protein kinase [Pseudomonas sp. R3.Fl]UUC49366.1 serine/threonine protein kinase [Pseudomonas citronellolis]GBL59602.1 serine-threonine kinase Stk1 [Pseudomonas citronellolis]